MIRLRKPKIDGKTLPEQIQQISRFLYQMVEEIENSDLAVGIKDIKIENDHLKIRYTNSDNYIDLGKVVGSNGKTPVKGVDYFTSEDKAEIVNEVSALLINE